MDLDKNAILCVRFCLWGNQITTVISTLRVLFSSGNERVRERGRERERQSERRIYIASSDKLNKMQRRQAHVATTD